LAQTPTVISPVWETPKPRAAFVWAIVLLAFRQLGDCSDSREKLAIALENNPHVPAYLLGEKKLPSRLSDRLGIGGENEAIRYAAENLDAWRTTSGALAWLAERINAEKSAPPN
jgi:hypothetical protein